MKHVKHLSLALAMLIHFVSFGQLKTITGQVVDEQGTLLPGAYISIKGTKKYVTSDLDGKFSMSVNIGATLTVSYIGYQTKEVVIGKENHYIIQLNAETKVLDEVVISQGYRLVTKKTCVAATSVVVNGKKIKNQPNANVTQTLQGQIVGIPINVTEEKNKIFLSPNSFFSSDFVEFQVNVDDYEKYDRITYPTSLKNAFTIWVSDEDEIDPVKFSPSTPTSIIEYYVDRSKKPQDKSDEKDKDNAQRVGQKMFDIFLNHNFCQIIVN
jgi:hypothetical protein